MRSPWDKELHFELSLLKQDLILEIDERRMRQAILNLLFNAVKFTLPGGTVSLQTIILTESESQDSTMYSSPKPMLRICIQDTGIGISLENQEKLFKPFSQIDSALNRQYEGTGLGLYLTRQIVELHGGILTMVSKPGQGSRFLIDLPCDVCI